MLNIPARFHALLSRHNTTMYRVAQVTGMPVSHIQKITSGRVRNPGILTLERIVEAAGGTLYELLDPALIDESLAEPGAGPLESDPYPAPRRGVPAARFLGVRRLANGGHSATLRQGDNTFNLGSFPTAEAAARKWDRESIRSGSYDSTPGYILNFPDEVDERRAEIGRMSAAAPPARPETPPATRSIWID